MIEGWYYYNNEKCYIQKLLNEYYIWSPSNGWIEYNKKINIKKI